jgi:NADP-dependent 3-hydroxy acid dehydrogenase YdfG
MSGKLDGKTALVTGASSGIGEATALALASEGAKVAIAARRADRLETLAARIRDGGSGHAFPITADVAQEDDARNMVIMANEQMGGIDILVNNAGVMLLGMIGGADTEDWRRMIHTNVLGLMYATHAVLPIMKGHGGGHIVNVSSVAGRTATVGSGVYNASKWGVGAFSESLRQEVCKDKIRVTLIEPGAVATELTEHITDQAAKERVRGWISQMTPLEAEDIAAAIVYAVTQPPRVNVNEILIRPTDQER